VVNKPSYANHVLNKSNFLQVIYSRVWRINTLQSMGDNKPSAHQRKAMACQIRPFSRHQSGFPRACVN